MSASSDFSFPIERQFDIRGMSCASCVARVEKALRQLTGVIDVSVNLATEEVSLKTTPEVQVAELAAAVRNAGYEVATQTIEFQIDCMSCASCVGRVEKALLKLPGVLTASVNLATEKATVEALSRVAFSELQAAITKAGYTAHPVATQQPEATPVPVVPSGWWPIRAKAMRCCLTPMPGPLLLWVGCRVVASTTI